MDDFVTGYVQMGFTPEELAQSNKPTERGHRLPTSSPPPPPPDVDADADVDMDHFEDAAGDAGPAASSSTARPPYSQPRPPSKSKRTVRFDLPLPDQGASKSRPKKIIKSAALVEDSEGDSDASTAAAPTASNGTKTPSRARARASTAKGKGKAEEQKSLFSDIDSSEAEDVEREQNPRKPGRLSAEQMQEAEAKAQEIENWVAAKSEEWGKTPKTLYDLLGMLQKLGRGANLWNMFQERWAATEAWLENGTLGSPSRLSA